MSEITFHNVLITVSAKTPKLAYAKLCRALNREDIEYTTDTYTVYDTINETPTVPQRTRKLFPNPGATE